MEGAKCMAFLLENMLEGAKELSLRLKITVSLRDYAEHSARATIEWCRLKHIHGLE